MIVVTGASSGIGRATALEMARRGAQVALLARRPEPLEELARECRGLCLRALALPTDTGDETAEKNATSAVIADLKQIDVWVNNAGVLALGRFLDMPPAAFRRVVDVNSMEYVNGAYAALGHFLERGGGVLINVSQGRQSPMGY